MSDTNIVSNTYSYRSAIAPRHVTFTRRTPVSAGRTIVHTVYSNAPAITNSYLVSGIPLKPKNSAIVSISENRENEKRQLSQLNDKFANYVERVHFLEVHNKKLEMELDNLRKRAGGESGKIRDMYETEIKEAKQIADDTKKDKANAEIKAKIAEQEADKFKTRLNEVLKNRDNDKARIQDLNKKIADNEAEINLLKRRISDLIDEAKRFKDEAQRLLGEIKRVTAELDSETLQRVQLENEKNALEEELNFLTRVHAQELEELRRKAFVDTGLDSSQFFKSELANAIREIRNEYEKINNDNRTDMENWYRLKIQEVQTKRPEPADSLIAREETRKLRTAVSDQRRDIANLKAKNAELETRIKEIEDLLLNEQREGQELIDLKDDEIKALQKRKEELLKDYEELTKMKTTLQDEINTYRKLLEGEENKEGLKQVVESIEVRNRQNVLNNAIGRIGK